MDSIRPNSQARAASDRVLKNLAAHSHLSIRTPVIIPFSSRTPVCGAAHASAPLLFRLVPIRRLRRLPVRTDGSDRRRAAAAVLLHLLIRGLAMSSKDILDPVLITFAALLPFAAMALLGYVVWLRVRHLRCKAGRHDWVQMDNGDRRCRSCKLVRKFVEPKPVVAKPPEGVQMLAAPIGFRTLRRYKP